MKDDIKRHLGAGLKNGGMNARELAERFGHVPIVGRSDAASIEGCFRTLVGIVRTGINELKGDTGPNRPRGWFWPQTNPTTHMGWFPVQAQKGFSGP